MVSGSQFSVHCSCFRRSDDGGWGSASLEERRRLEAEDRREMKRSDSRFTSLRSIASASHAVHCSRLLTQLEDGKL
jgi:hypothetical protein